MDKPAAQITSALMLEYEERADTYEEALKLWQKLRTPEACERTILILKRLKDAKYCYKYASWVFQTNPEVALTLFAR
jgi:hypothetical protein